MILLECPVCEYMTLPERATYAICPVCDWEDEGNESYTDNSTSTGGPNGNLSINQARERFRDQSADNAGTYRRIIDLSTSELHTLRDQLQKEGTKPSSNHSATQLSPEVITQLAKSNLLKKVDDRLA